MGIWVVEDGMIVRRNLERMLFPIHVDKLSWRHAITPWLANTCCDCILFFYQPLRARLNGLLLSTGKQSLGICVDVLL